MKDLSYSLWFKFRAKGCFLSNCYPPGHRMHRSGVIEMDNGCPVVRNFYGKQELRFSSAKGLYRCMKMGYYQVIESRSV